MLLNPSRTLLILLAIVCYKICRYAVQNTTSCPCLTVCKISDFYFGWINLSTFLALTLLFFWQDDEVVLQSVATIQKEHRKFCLAVEGLGNRLCYLESTSEAKVRMPKSFVYCATEEHSKSDVVYICWLHIKLKFIATYIQSCLPVVDLCNCLVIESVRLLQTGLQQEKKNFSVVTGFFFPLKRGSWGLILTEPSRRAGNQAATPWKNVYSLASFNAVAGGSWLSICESCRPPKNLFLIALIASELHDHL